MSDGNFRGAPPPARNKLVFWVEQIGAQERQKWRVWSPQVWGVWTHWTGKTKPCYEDHNHCEGGHDPATLRWKGYFLGWCFKRNKPAFCQITDAALDSWNEQLAKGVTLRGQTIYVQRTEKKKGRLSISLAPYEGDHGQNLPPDADPRATLHNLWEICDHGWKWAVDPVRNMVLSLDSESA